MEHEFIYTPTYNSELLFLQHLFDHSENQYFQIYIFKSIFYVISKLIFWFTYNLICISTNNLERFYSTFCMDFNSYF